MNKNMDVIALKKSSFLTHIIVSQGDWLWKPANIKGENNGSVVYFQSFLTVHNPMAQWWDHSPSTNVILVQFWSGFPLSLTTNSSKFQLDLEGADTFQPVLLNS